MKHKLFLSNRKGQAMVETILFLPLIAVFIVMIAWFAELMITRQQLLMAARYGTDLIVYTSMDEQQIRGQITDYLCGKNMPGRKLDPKRLPEKNIKIKIERFHTVRVDEFNPFSWLRCTQDIMDTKTSSVDIYYEFNIPGMFSAFSFLSGGALPKTIRLAGRSEVLAGTGA